MKVQLDRQNESSEEEIEIDKGSNEVEALGKERKKESKGRREREEELNR